MAYKEHKIIPVYKTIGDIAKELNLTTGIIRFWEKEGFISSKRNNKTNDNNSIRRFLIADYKVIKILKALRGFGVEFKLIRHALKKGYAQDLVDYLNRMK